jgi:CHAT domain-containing protein
LLSPDGPLWDLPFAALVINTQGPPQYLGLEAPLTYTQSLTTFGQTMARPPVAAAKRNVVIIGNPLYDNALRPMAAANRPERTGVPLKPAGGKRARGEVALLSSDGTIPPPLPFAEVEARRVAALYGVQPSIGVEPTEAWFRRRAADVSIMHLATHGFFNPFRALSSGVHLAVPPQDLNPGETDNDGALQAWEVFTQLQLRADLVVLSACDSGVGSKGSAEGLVGLTRAFQVAGAGSVVATQWKVQDQSTAQAMVTFHQNLVKGLPRDRALQLAMRQLAADPVTRDPYFWAPFILVGDSRPLPAAR